MANYQVEVKFGQRGFLTPISAVDAAVEHAKVASWKVTDEADGRVSYVYPTSPAPDLVLRQAARAVLAAHDGPNQKVDLLNALGALEKVLDKLPKWLGT